MDASVAKPARAYTSLHCALAVLIIAAATIGGALAFQAAGIRPCELCLKERLPYYVGMALAVATVAAAWRRPGLAARVGFVALALLFLFSAGLGTYHAGVEWGFWPGPSDCTGSLDRVRSNQDFLKQLETVQVVRCDAVAVRIAGLSLAGWNALISVALACLALAGLFRAREG